MGVVIVRLGAFRGSKRQQPTAPHDHAHIWGCVIVQTSEIQAADNGRKAQMKMKWKMKTSEIGKDREGEFGSSVLQC